MTQGRVRVIAVYYHILPVCSFCRLDLSFNVYPCVPFVYSVPSSFHTFLVLVLSDGE